MAFVGKLARNLCIAIAAASLVAWLVEERTFDLSPAQLVSLRLGLVLGIPIECALLAALVARLARPIRTALERAGTVQETAAVAAALCGSRLPRRVAAAVLALGALTTAVLLLLVRREGMPWDLALAGAAIGAAVSLLVAMLGYSLAATASARAVEALGPRADLGVRGSVRGKILVLGVGLNAIAFLLFAGSGYARFRAEVQRDAVADAERGQQSAIASGPDDPDLPRHVWFATGAPSVLLSPSAAVVGRFGGELPPVTPGPLGAERVADPPGWLVRARAPGGGLLVTWIAESRLRDRWSAFLSNLAVVGLVTFAAGAAVAWAGARTVTVPFRALGRAADRVATGDLTASPPTISRDEIGQLAADFRRMAQGLKGLVGEVQSASDGVSIGAREAAAIGERVRAGARDQHGAVQAMQAAVEAMEGSVSQVSRGMGGLTDHVATTTAAISEAGTALDEVRQKGAELEKAVAAVLRDVDQLAAAGREADGSLGELGTVAERAGATLSGLKASLTALERAAAESESNAIVAAEVAQRAEGAVEEAVHGIEAVKAAVSDAHRRITTLGRRSEDVDRVVDFVSEVAGRTNLLSLNASIIASQAGEHGKAFAVVADQIRELAVQIGRSTKSIGDTIHAVREEIGATAALIDRGDALAAEGVQLARGSLEAIGKIQRSTQQGREAVAAIGAAVGTHAATAREIASEVQSVAEGSRAVGAAVQLVGRGVSGVGALVRGVQAVADQIARAVDDQAGTGKRDLESIAHLERMIGETARAVENHGAATRRVREALRNLSDGAGHHEDAVEGLAGVAERLGTRATALAERVGRFKT